MFLQSYLHGWLQCVLVDGIYSKETSITCGVPKWSILGPLLFGIFINYLPLCLSSKSVKRDLFADDGTLNTANDNIDNIRKDLQQSLDDVSDRGCADFIEPNYNKMYVDGDYTKTPERKVLFEFKSLVHANRTGFRAKLTRSNCRWAAKVADTY